jgi:isoquinoline 1-oxidoreductase alpha subunit
MSISINGRPVVVPAEWREETLLNFLRESQGLVGAKYGCGAGLCDAASVLRGHPDYQAPESMRAAIRAVLAQEGFMERGRPQ